MAKTDSTKIPASSAASSGGVRRRVTDSLRAAIVTGELVAGQVYSAPRLGVQLGVSATPVREAMLDLLKEGLVRTVPNKGFEVLAPSVVALQDILELRLLLEVPVARMITDRGVREADLVELRWRASETVVTAEALDVVGHVAADLAFHLSLLDLWGNDELTDTVRVLRSRSRLAGLWSVENHNAMIDSAHEHLKLVELIRQGDGAAASELMRSHISRTVALWSERALLVDARPPTDDQTRLATRPQ